jgi:hypothetical protein
MANSALAMPQRFEDATIRMRLPENVARSTEMAMVDGKGNGNSNG